MLFHGLSGGEVRIFIDAIDRREKNESTTISTINMGKTDADAIMCSGDGAFPCAGCGGQITDRYYLLAVDKQWHMRCLKCCECKLNLASELSCFSKNGSIFCKEDYYRRFSVQRCGRCQFGISASEMVMRAKDLVYHLNCFTCTTCNKILTTGDHFGMKDGLVYCRLHFQTLVEERNYSCFIHEDEVKCNGEAFGSLGLGYCSSMSSAQRGRKRRNTGRGTDPASYKAAVTCSEMDRDSSHKSKRMRTSFKHHQLRTMKSYFAINHNPDAKDLKQLSQKTGLTKRVLQVWFQNARAKFRRGLLRSAGTEKASDGSTLPGGSPSGPCSEASNVSLSPCSTPLATLMDLSDPSLSRVTSTPGGPDLEDSRSPLLPSLTPCTPSSFGF
ncbi:hypothetical protein COCON_G00166970 [Conger conger]|uniref:LIM/homeobox protein Lhx9 n=1 Tax=Conger conger TaxID=82655 RepID=A0A9Q1HTB5_CONCO|nr:LIM/homeobox protein Lhx2-like [Conger conger]KAJ8260974.1 hypothetical protein COCON_G00166970 [Conger conger]